MSWWPQVYFACVCSVCSLLFVAVLFILGFFVCVQRAPLVEYVNDSPVFDFEKLLEVRVHDSHLHAVVCFTRV